MAEDNVNLVGTLEKILYSNLENGFLIATFLVENTTKPITVKGIVFNTHERETLLLKGCWENHKVYGRQDPQPAQFCNADSHCSKVQPFFPDLILHVRKPVLTL